ncbi:MAG TPA: TonB-dependent receptor [Blastocatellia bacterium]|nr:TonB-dependent receptor [Blastocatellia bacterium]
MHRIKVLSTLFILALALTGSVFGQTTSGSIAGNLTDPNQAAIAGATVTVSDDAKSFSQSTTTDKEGRFVFPTLPPGTYKLTVEAKGFKKSERTGLLLVANDKLTLGDLAMEVGAASETVTVTADATLLQAESAERSLAIQGEALRSIAVNGRGFTPLASLTPGIIFNTNNGSSDAITNIFANGLRSSANNLTLDGVAIVDTGNNGTLLSLNLDSVSEFKVLTSNYQAEYGRSAGAQISAVTRGGTRDFHGSFYTFRRHDGMNANTWINNRDSTATNRINKPRLDQRDIGFTIGGPIYIPKVFNTDKQKLFFFFSEEHQKRFIPPAGPTRVTVPTALERTGDFSQTRDNSGNLFPYIRDYTLNAPCNATDQSGCFKDGGVLGKIPANRLYPLGLNILKIYPLPNTTGVGFNYITEQPSSQPQRQDLVRIDYNLNSAWHVFGRYVKVKNDQVLPYGSFVLATNMPDFNVLLPNPRYSYSGTVTGSLNATTILEATIGGSHNSIDINPANTKFNKTGLGLTGIPVIYPGAVQIDSPPQFNFGGRIANAPNIGSNNAPFYNFNTTRDWSVSLSKIARQHTIKVGAFWQNSFKPQSSFANNNGQYNFSDSTSNPFDTQFGFANAATGVYQTFNQASAYVIGKYRYNNIEWFAQDNWKVNNRLTLDYGMRFYWIQPQFDEDLQAANFLPNRFNPADASLLYRPVCIANTATCSGNNRRAVDPRLLVGGFIPSAANTIDGAYIGRIVPNTGKLTNGVVQAGAGIEKGVYKNRGVHFAPRFGFAYDVFGNQSLVVRGGGGMFYDRPQGNVVFDLVRNPPTTLEPTFFFGRMQDLNSGQVLLGPPALVAYDHEGKSPTSYSFNLGIQKRIAPLDAVLDVSYVGTLGVHLLQRRNINAPAYGAAYLPQNQDPTLAPSTTGSGTLPVDFLRPYQGFGNISYIEPASSSNYHSLQTSINRRFSKGLLLGVTYTWSKALGTQANDLPGINGFGAVRADNNQRRANYAPQDFDRRHNFNVNWVYELPKATQNKALGYIANDWQISGIYRYQTGAPYNIGFNIPGLSAYGVTGTQQIEGGRIVIVGDPGSGSSSDPYRQFNVAAFTVPGLGSKGLESGRNFLYRSPINAWDLSLSKEFKFTERAKIEIRLDAFNALNHTQFDGYNTTLNVTSLTNPTPTNLASETGNRTGFGAVTSVRPPRNMQLSARFQF